jgi:guanylate kinase
MIKLISLTGVSGAGKTTLARHLLATDPRMKLIASCTTRAPRSTDIESEYHYLSDAQFEEMKSEDRFLWSVAFAGAKYGTPKESILSVFSDEKRISLMILVPLVIPTLLEFLPSDMQQKYLRAFLVSPGEHELRSRLKARGDEESVIQDRLSVSSQWESEARHSPFGFQFLHTKQQTVDETARVLLRFVD